MPELPDVEIFKQYLDATGLHQKIEDVCIERGQYLQDASSNQIQTALQGQVLQQTHRHGKYLFAELDHGHWLVLHFGMTGGLSYYKVDGDEPDHTRMLIRYQNGYHLAYISQRKLGEIALTADVETFVEERELGIDALDPKLDQAAFVDILADSRAMIKSALMDQQRIAGIGNVYADEILYQARVHPKTKVNELDRDTLSRIYQQMKAVLQTAIECRAEPDQLPDTYIIPQRHEGGICPTCEGEVQQLEVSGRTTYYCPTCQTR